MPDIMFSSKEEIPESLREHAKEKDGKFAVGVVHESFRNKNITLLQERDGLQTKVDAFSKLVGDDPDKFTSDLVALRETEQLVKDGKLSKKDDIEREIAARLKAKEDGYTVQIKAKAEESAANRARSDAFEAKYKGQMVDTAIISAVTSGDSGANLSALPDILNRARGVFVSKDDGTLVAKRGDTIIYGADGESSISPKEWLAGLLKEAPYLGKESSGSGGQGAGGDKRGGVSEAEFMKLTPAERITRVRSAGKA